MLSLLKNKSSVTVVLMVTAMRMVFHTRCSTASKSPAPIKKADYNLRCHGKRLRIDVGKHGDDVGVNLVVITTMPITLTKRIITICEIW